MHVYYLKVKFWNASTATNLLFMHLELVLAISIKHRSTKASKSSDEKKIFYCLCI